MKKEILGLNDEEVKSSYLMYGDNSFKRKNEKDFLGNLLKIYPTLLLEF